MGELVIRDLSEKVRADLLRRAVQHKRSLEAEVREVLNQAAAEYADNPATVSEPGDAWIKRVETHPVETEAWEVFEQSLNRSRSAWRDKRLDLG
jgi:plasmid stability protein